MDTAGALAGGALAIEPMGCAFSGYNKRGGRRHGRARNDSRVDVMTVKIRLGCEPPVHRACPEPPPFVDVPKPSPPIDRVVVYPRDASRARGRRGNRETKPFPARRFSSAFSSAAFSSRAPSGRGCAAANRIGLTRARTRDAQDERRDSLGVVFSREEGEEGEEGTLPFDRFFSLGPDRRRRPFFFCRRIEARRARGGHAHAAAATRHRNLARISARFLRIASSSRANTAATRLDDLRVIARSAALFLGRARRSRAKDAFDAARASSAPTSSSSAFSHSRLASPSNAHGTFDATSARAEEGSRGDVRRPRSPLR